MEACIQKIIWCEKSDMEDRETERHGERASERERERQREREKRGGGGLSET